MTLPSSFTSENRISVLTGFQNAIINKKFTREEDFIYGGLGLGSSGQNSDGSCQLDGDFCEFVGGMIL